MRTSRFGWCEEVDSAVFMAAAVALWPPPPLPYKSKMVGRDVDVDIGDGWLKGDGGVRVSAGGRRRRCGVLVRRWDCGGTCRSRVVRLFKEYDKATAMRRQLHVYARDWRADRGSTGILMNFVERFTENGDELFS